MQPDLCKFCNKKLEHFKLEMRFALSKIKCLKTPFTLIALMEQNAEEEEKKKRARHICIG